MDILSSFNLIDLMQIMTAGFAMLLAFPLMLSRDRGQARLLLAVFILIQGALALWAVVNFSPAFFEATEELLRPFEHVPQITLQGLQGPILLWYSYGLSGTPPQPTWFDKTVIAVFVLLPAPIAWLVSPISTYDFVVWVNLGWLTSIIYGARAVREVFKHNREIRQRYSNIDERRLLWLGYLAFGFIGVWGMRLSAAVVGRVTEYSAGTISMLSTFPVAILICWMAVLGMGQGLRVADRAKTQASRHTEDGATTNINPEAIEKLDDLMSRVKLYQDPDLHLDGLADSMGISTRSLSALINGHFKKNFYDFVNDYRARDAQKQLQDPENESKTIQRIFEDAGFKSKSTFNTHFKKVTGKTPTEYRKAAHSGFSAHLGRSA